MRLRRWPSVPPSHLVSSISSFRLAARERPCSKTVLHQTCFVQSTVVEPQAKEDAHFRAIVPEICALCAKTAELKVLLADRCRAHAAAPLSIAVCIVDASFAVTPLSEKLQCSSILTLCRGARVCTQGHQECCSVGFGSCVFL